MDGFGGNGNDLSGGVAPNYDGASNMVNFDSGDHLTVLTETH